VPACGADAKAGAKLHSEQFCRFVIVQSFFVVIINELSHHHHHHDLLHKF